MGLDTSHGCWHGPYSAFHRFRADIAEAVGINLSTMEGFDRSIPRPPCEHVTHPATKWEALAQRPLLILLSHSDCEGDIAAADCDAIADDLQKVLASSEALQANWKQRIDDFINGLRDAALSDEPVVFH